MASSLFTNNSQVMQTQQAINPQMISNIKNITGMLKNNQNPEQMLQMLAQQNPQVSQIMNLINNGGTTAKDLFMKQAQQMGINPNDLINQLK